MLSLFVATASAATVPLTKGMFTTESTAIKKGVCFLEADASLSNSVIVVEGNNITVDFNGAELSGSNDKALPNEFKGLAVLIKGNINYQNVCNQITEGGLWRNDTAYKDVPAENFVEIATTKISLSDSGDYTLGISVAYAVKVYVDDKIVINVDGISKLVYDADYYHEAKIPLTKGTHIIRIERMQ